MNDFVTFLKKNRTQYSDNCKVSKFKNVLYTFDLKYMYSVHKLQSCPILLIMLTAGQLLTIKSKQIRITSPRESTSIIKVFVIQEIASHLVKVFFYIIQTLYTHRWGLLWRAHQDWSSAAGRWILSLLLSYVHIISIFVQIHHSENWRMIAFLYTYNVVK